MESCYVLEIIGKKNKNFKLVASDTVELQKHQKKGGQSAPRFEKNRMIERNHYNKKVSEVIRSAYMRKNDTECIVKGIIVGGVGDIKKEIMEQPLFVQYFSNIVMKVVSTDGINDGTIHDVYNKCLDVLSFFDISSVNDSIDEVKSMILRADNKLVFGRSEILTELKECSIKKIIVSEDLLDEKVKEIIKAVEYVVVPHNLIEIYGGIVGIKYFASTDDYQNTEPTDDNTFNDCEAYM